MRIKFKYKDCTEYWYSIYTNVCITGEGYIDINTIDFRYAYLGQTKSVKDFLFEYLAETLEFDLDKFEFDENDLNDFEKAIT